MNNVYAAKRINLCIQSLVCNLNELVECVHVADCEVGENLAVHINTGNLEAVDEVGIVGSAAPCARIDTSDPKLAVLPLVELTASIGISHGLHDLLACRTIEFALCSVVALGEFKNFTTLFNCVYCSFNPCHCE